MLTIVGILIVLVLVGYGTYSGAREGAFYSTYVLLRTVTGLLIAMTFTVPLTDFAASAMGAEYPWYDYLLLIVFVALYAATTTILRQFKVRATSPSIPCIGIFDTIYGAIVGFAGGIVGSGVFLITISLIPALPYMSPTVSRFEMSDKAMDTGGPVLAFYDFASERFGGNMDFPLEAEAQEPVQEEDDQNQNNKVDFPGEAFRDVNGNGRWDRSWLQRYRTCWQFGTVEAARAGYQLAAPREDVEEEVPE